MVILIFSLEEVRLQPSFAGAAGALAHIAADERGPDPGRAGLAMMARGAWRRRRDQELIRLDKFAYGYLFALAMALVRFNFGS
jgi:hypothetical protein